MSMEDRTMEEKSEEESLKQEDKTFDLTELEVCII